jgi:hypothetical protein
LLACRVGDEAFLGLPGADGTLRVAYSSGVTESPELWTPGDFYGVSRLVEGETGFRAYVEEQDEYRRQLATLKRLELRMSTQTPWGCADFSYRYAEGVVRHSTPSHGGFQLDAERNALVHPAYRNLDGWYESHDDGERSNLWQTKMAKANSSEDPCKSRRARPKARSLSTPTSLQYSSR